MSIYDVILLKVKLRFRYSIGDYKSIKTVKELPRSLGPDWEEVGKKAASRNRRQSYAEYVAARNSQLPKQNRLPRISEHLNARQIALQYAKSTSVFVSNKRNTVL